MCDIDNVANIPAGWAGRVPRGHAGLGHLLLLGEQARATHVAVGEEGTGGQAKLNKEKKKLSVFGFPGRIQTKA